MDDSKVLFYDIECFKYDSLVVFKNIDNQIVDYFWSHSYENEDEPNGFQRVGYLIKGKTLCGYNNHFYDDWMLSAMMQGKTARQLKRLNDQLIESGDHTGYTLHPIIDSIDCMQQIDVSHPSLKLIEGNMGKSIYESSISFDLDRPLTEAEKKEVLRYCCYDVEQTIEIYKLRKHSYFEIKEQLVDMLGNPKAKKWNTTTISANLLVSDSRPTSEWSDLRNIPKRFWRNVEGIPAEVWDMWAKASRDTTDAEDKGVKGLNVKTRLYDMDFVFGFGGLHGANARQKEFRNVFLLDVGSMYPSIIILLKALGPGTEKYDQIRKERLEIKHKDKVKSNALKLVLNSVYGNMKNKYSILKNSVAASTVCIYGQMALFDLCRELFEAGYTLVNANTDGIAFTASIFRQDREFESIWHQWEEKWGLNLELDKFDWWYQKDVNNYIATHDGNIKVKGGEVNKFHCDPMNGVHRYFSNNNCRILHIALVEALVHDVDPFITIKNNLTNPILYQYVLKAGSTYLGVFDQNGNQYQKVNRVFACTDPSKSIKLYKKRLDGGLVNFPDSPERMLLFNGNLDEFNETNLIDVRHYVELTAKKLIQWDRGDLVRKWGLLPIEDIA